MLITFPILCDWTRHMGFLDIITTSDFTFRNVAFWNESLRCQLPDTLYIADANTTTDYCQATVPSCLMIVGNVSEFLVSLPSQPAYLLLLKTEYTAEDVYSEIQKNTENIQSWADRLLWSVLAGDGFCQYLNIIHDVLHNPIWIIDNNNCLLSYTKNDQSDEIAWKETVRTGYISFYGSTAREIEEAMERFRAGTSATVIHLKAIKSPLITTKIYLEHEPVGMMNVLSTHSSPTAGQLDLCMYAAKLLSMEFRRRKLKQAFQEFPSSQFLLELLNGRLSDEIVAKAALETIAWTAKRWFSLMIIPITCFSQKDNIQNRIAGQLFSLFPNSITISYQECLVCLMTHNQKTFLTVQKQKQLENFLDQYEFFAGISDSFNELTFVPKAYQHGLSAVKTTVNMNPKQRIFFYKDYAFLHIQHILAEYDTLEHFCYQGILNLIAYDQKNHTEYTRTLWLYLKNNLSPGQTAKDLFLHRSTLNYRMQKIQEIANLDLKNSDMIFLANLSLRLLDFPSSYYESVKYDL